MNVDKQEIAKFEAMASRWWDPAGDFKPLHQINPLRLDYIDERSGGLFGKRVLDVGCGGGILTESMARRGAQALGVDMGKEPLNVAKLHALETGTEVEYRQVLIEELADEQPNSFDVITCMEMLEHVPDPGSVVNACMRLVKPGGHVFFSTINRNLKSYLFMIVGAEKIMKMMPNGTHDHKKFIRPSELLHWVDQSGLYCHHMTGLHYIPIVDQFKLGENVDVNYMLHTQLID